MIKNITSSAFGPTLLMVLSCCLVGPYPVNGQDGPILENNPPSLRWYQMRTPHFQVIFPAGFDSQALRMANTLEHIRVPESRSLGTPSVPLPVILQNRSSISNGFVALGPRRSEFYTMSTQNYNFLGSNDWLNLLASHEYRHMAQYSHANRGFNRLIYRISGQEALAGMSFLAAPQWFWEGDAVATETAFTHSGRGRIPEFDLVFRTNLLERKDFGYNKQYLRSYRNYIPDHYVLGYHLVSYLRKTSGMPGIWGVVSGDAWSVPFKPLTFSASVHRNSGFYLNRFYAKMAADMKSEWQEYLSRLQFTPFEIVSKRKNGIYTNYSYPQYLADGRVLALKAGLADVQQLVVLGGPEEDGKHIPGPVNDSGMLSAVGSRVVWNEFRFDPRWPMVSWSVIRVHNTDSSKLLARTLTAKTRYAGASLSPDGTRIATVEQTQEYGARVVVLDAFNGKVIRTCNGLDGAYYSMVRWYETGDALVALRTTQDGKAVVRIGIDDGTEAELIPVSNRNVGHPVISGHHLFYNAPSGGIDNLFAMNLKSGRHYQVTVARYGAYNPSVSPDKKHIVYNNQSRDGMDVVRIPYDTTTWIADPVEPANAPNSWRHLVEQEGRPGLFDSIPKTTYPVERYHRGAHLIKVHSWGAFVSTDLRSGRFGITSKDVLSNLSLNAGLEFDLQERTISTETRASFQTFLPIIDVEYQSGLRDVKVAEDLEIITAIRNGDTTRVVEDVSFTWKEKTLETGLRLPLNLTHSRFFTQINTGLYFGSTTVSDFKNSFNGGGRVITQDIPQYFFRSYQDNGRLLYSRFGLTAYNLMKRSPRDINSRWGQMIDLTASGTLGKSDFSGGQQSLVTWLYFPGLFRNHSFWGYWAYQNTRITWRERDNYTFRNQIPVARGAGVGRYEQMYAMSANYALPLFYPDLHLGPLVNVKRVRLNGFTDYVFADNPGLQAITKENESRTYLSVGGEVKFDINLLRLLPELDFGIRVAQVLRPRKEFFFEFILGTISF